MTGQLRLVAEPDPRVWVELPGPWPSPDWSDAEQWASATARTQLAAYDLADPQRVAVTTEVLRRLAETYPREEHEDVAWLHWPSLDRAPAVATVWVADLADADASVADASGGDPDEVLRAVLGVDDDRLVEPATVTAVPAPHGPALRAMLYVLGDDGALLVSLRYALHLGGAVYARVLTASYRPGEVLDVQDDLDAFVRTVAVHQEGTGPVAAGPAS